MCPQATRLPGWLPAAQPWPQRWNAPDWALGSAARSVRLPDLAAVVVLVPFTLSGTMLPPSTYTGGLSVVSAWFTDKQCQHFERSIGVQSKVHLKSIYA